MTSQSDQKVVKDGQVKEAGKFDRQIFNEMADHVFEIWQQRVNKRRDDGLNKKWAEIDRQLRMEPKNPHKMLPDGRPDVKKRWMAEMELPLQAQTLEVLTADARRLTLPDTGTWYEAAVNLSDEYAERLQGFGLDAFGVPEPTERLPAAQMSGDDNDIPSLFMQTNANNLLEGIQDYFRSQYDFGSNLDKINAEAFKYGTGIARGRVVTKAQVLSLSSGAIRETTKFPALLPISIKNTYLDDNPHAILHEGHVIDTGVIQHRDVKLEDIVIAATKGGKSPESVDGGWMPSELADVKPKGKKGNVDLIEFEGDVVVPRKNGESLVLEGVLITVLVGKTGKGGPRATVKRTIRFRFRKMPFNSYIVFPYHCEDMNDAYATSPLMKGRPIQMSAVDALNRLLDSAGLNIMPPVGFDRADMYFAQEGGPQIAPYATWKTTSEINVYDEVGGDPSAMAAILRQLIELYYDVTGADPVRFGERTRSHTTAFAKNAEIQTGQARIVDYVRNSLKGPLTRWLYMEKDLLRMSLTTTPQSIFIPKYRAWMDVTRDVLPDDVWYNAIGASGPLEAAQKRAERFQALQNALAIDNLGTQLGGQRVLSLRKIVDAILSEGGWTDIDALKSEQAVSGPEPGIAQATAEGTGTAAPAAVSAIPQILAATGGQ